MPSRIQLSRKKGFRLPPNAVSVARPGKWGNPFSVLPRQELGSKGSAKGYIAVPTVKDAVERFRLWLTKNEDGKALAIDAKKELKGKDLACWCKPGDLCHADILLEIANQ